MTTDIKLPPLPKYLYGREASDNERVVTVADAHAYAIRSVALATAAKDAEIERLRVRADAMAGEAIKHEARAERLAEALRGLVAYVRETAHHNAPAAAAARAALRDHDQEVGNG